ncbi:MAG: hypothetical protein NVS1B4_07060 [Gemmatimonadaceae bacterium]
MHPAYLSESARIANARACHLPELQDALPRPPVQGCRLGVTDQTLIGPDDGASTGPS